MVHGPWTLEHGTQTLANRFGFRGKPPVVMVTTGKGTPALIDSRDLSAAELVARRRIVRPAGSLLTRG